MEKKKKEIFLKVQNTEKKSEIFFIFLKVVINV